MQPRYSRNIPALTEEECTLLRTKKIAVIGCGGLGGHIVELLARIGIGSIRAVDGDVFDVSNLNRQLLSEVALLGTSKAMAAVQRIGSINPDTRVEPVCEFLTAENAAQLLADCDAAVDALDNIESRRILAAACADAGIPYIYGAISGWVAQAAISMPGDHLIDILYPADVRITAQSVLSFTPALCAAMQTSLCIKLLTGKPVETGVLHYTDLFYEEYTKIPIK